MKAVYLLLHGTRALCAFSGQPEALRAVFRLPVALSDECVIAELPLDPALEFQSGEIVVLPEGVTAPTPPPERSERGRGGVSSLPC